MKLAALALVAGCNAIVGVHEVHLGDAGAAAVDAPVGTPDAQRLDATAGSPDADLCGNGTVDPGEDCDFGPGQNVSGFGCEPNCKFSCTTTPVDSCQQGMGCSGTGTCGPVQFGPHTGQKCTSGSPLPACSSCGTAGVCVDSLCAASMCGDGCVDVDQGEQCDDSNLVSGDGCDSSCRFEQVVRFTSMPMQFGTDGFCTVNALGGAIQSVAQSTLVNTVSNGIASGSLNMLFEMTGIPDLDGVSGGGFDMDALGGIPQMPSGSSGYNGASDLDWWYSVDPAIAQTVVSMSLDASAITTTAPAPWNASFAFTGGPPVPVHAANMMFTATTGSPSAPSLSTNALPPGHLSPPESFAPGLTSFSQLTGGKICFSVTAASLAGMAIPSNLVSGGAEGCDQSYPPTASVLDLYIHGCTKFSFGVVTAEAPDQIDPAAPVPSGTPPFTLSSSSGTHVDTCKDAGGNPVDFATCANYLAYSAYFQFTADRVILRP